MALTASFLLEAGDATEPTGGADEATAPDGGTNGRPPPATLERPSGTHPQLTVHVQGTSSVSETDIRILQGSTGTLVDFRISEVKQAQSIEDVFRELANKWHEETGFISSPSDIAMHPAYQRILGMGEKALPFIFEDLRTRGGQWYWALRYITGASPVPPDASGNARRVRDTWLECGRTKGYIH